MTENAQITEWTKAINAKQRRGKHVSWGAKYGHNKKLWTKNACAGKDKQQFTRQILSVEPEAGG